MSRKRPAGVAAGVDAGAVGCDRIGDIAAGGAELARPALVAVGVVLAHEGVRHAKRSLVGKSRTHHPGNRHKAAAGGDAVGLIISAAAELARPYDVAVGVVLAQEGVGASGVALAGEGCRW